MAQGRVKWFNTKKGFGFIEPRDGSNAVFVHIDNVDGSSDGLQAGDEVVYEVGSTPMGLAAVKVERKGS